MNEITLEQVRAALESVGVQRGDGLLVHSAIQFLGRPVGGVEIYLEALRNVLGPGGTITVPAFNFAFARGEKYDPLVTPSSGMGAFSEYIRQQSYAQRTPHPMQSLVVLGHDTEDLTSRDTPSAFDPGSAYERMLELDYKIVLLGADVNAISLLHYSEQRAEVPYRYWKDFTGEVKTESGWQTLTYRMFVRDLELDPRLDLKPVQSSLEQHGLWAYVSINYGQISQCRARDFVDAIDEILAADPWALVTNK